MEVFIPFPVGVGVCTLCTQIPTKMRLIFFFFLFFPSDFKSLVGQWSIDSLLEWWLAVPLSLYIHPIIIPIKLTRFSWSSSHIVNRQHIQCEKSGFIYLPHSTTYQGTFDIIILEDKNFGMNGESRSHLYHIKPHNFFSLSYVVGLGNYFQRLFKVQKETYIFILLFLILNISQLFKKSNIFTI